MIRYTDITKVDHALLEQAVRTANRLYMENLQEVASALTTSNGQTFSAIHFETATGFSTICGEIAAICCLVAAGHRDLDTIVAVWQNPDGQCFLLPPCGRCREVIADFNPDARVIVSKGADHWGPKGIETPAIVAVSELLPLKSHALKVP